MTRRKSALTGTIVATALLSGIFVDAGAALAQEGAPQPAPPPAPPPQFVQGQPPPQYVQGPPPPQYMLVPPQEPASRGGIFFNPLAIAFGLISAELALGLNESLALTVNGSYWNVDAGSISMTAAGGGAGLMYFPNGRLFQGLYLAPSVQYASATATSSVDEATASLVGSRGIVGYHWDWHPFALKLGGGIQYYSGSASGGDVDITLTGAELAIDATIGFTWN
jgi:hypothetical protein